MTHNRAKDDKEQKVNIGRNLATKLDGSTEDSNGLLTTESIMKVD